MNDGPTTKLPARMCHPRVTPAYGMRPVGGFGVRGFRAFCPTCGHLGELRVNWFSARDDTMKHGLALPSTRERVS